MNKITFLFVPLYASSLFSACAHDTEVSADESVASAQVFVPISDVASLLRRLDDAVKQLGVTIPVQRLSDGQRQLGENQTIPNLLRDLFVQVARRPNQQEINKFNQSFEALLLNDETWRMLQGTIDVKEPWGLISASAENRAAELLTLKANLDTGSGLSNAESLLRQLHWNRMPHGLMASDPRAMQASHNALQNFWERWLASGTNHTGEDLTRSLAYFVSRSGMDGLPQDTQDLLKLIESNPKFLAQFRRELIYFRLGITEFEMPKGLTLLGQQNTS